MMWIIMSRHISTSFFVAIDPVYGIKGQFVTSVTQRDAITKVEQGVDSKAAVLSFSVTHCFANLFPFRRLGTQRRYSKPRASTKDLYEQKIDLHCQSRKTADLFSHKVLASASLLNLSNRIE